MSVTTPNMNLVEPVIATDTGLTWENAFNANAITIDQHNHTSGNGVQIPPAGLNINTALTFNNQQATNLNAAVFYQQSTSISTLNALFVKTDGNLYYNDGVGDTSIKITSGGSVNATTSGISSGNASASFSAGVLVVNSNTNTPANISCGSILLGNVVAGSKFLTLAPPASMAANYTLNLPSIPGSLSFLTLDTSGNIATASNVSGSQIAAATITGSQIASTTITGSNIAPQTLTQGLRAVPALSTTSAAAGGILLTPATSYSGSGTANTNIMSGSITTTGRPVFLQLQSPSTNVLGQFIVTNGQITIEAVNGSQIYLQTLGSSVSQQFFAPLTSFAWIDTSVIGTPGTYTYQLAITGGAAGTSWQLTNASLIAYEI